MNEDRRVEARATRARTAMLAALATAALAWGSAGCTAMIDQELSAKKSAHGGAAGGPDSAGGGAGGGTGNSTQTAPLSTGTQTTNTWSTTTQTPTGPCPQGCSLAHATSACDAGECVVVDCEQGFADCNEASSDGCEADLLHDEQHCGKCLHACDTSEGESCKEGKCK